MRSRGGGIVRIGVGVVVLAVGAVWIGQGLNLIPGSFMTGDRTWFLIGLFFAAVGIALIVFGVRRALRRG